MKRFRHLLRENPQLVWGGLIIGSLLTVCFVGIFLPFDPVAARNQNATPNLAPWFWYGCQDIGSAFASLFSGKGWVYKTSQGAAAGFWLGSDGYGISILVRIVKGTEAFFLPGILASMVALVGGGCIGAFSGYYGGKVAYVGRYLTTLINSFPNLVLVLLCVTVFGSHMLLVASMVGITFIPHIGEEIRRKVAQLKAEEFIMAAEAHGLRDRQILFYHIVWLHCSALIIRQLVFLWGYLIILETSLNYLGEGVLQKGNSWGKMLFDYKDKLFQTGAYWSPAVVTAIVMLSMSGFYFLAEGLQKWNDGIGRHMLDETPHAELSSSQKEGA